MTKGGAGLRARGAARKEDAMKLNVVKFALAFGIVYAAIFFLWGLAAAIFGWGGDMLKLMGDFYPGIGPNLGGALIGAVWGLVVGFVFFGVAAWLYNNLPGRS